MTFKYTVQYSGTVNVLVSAFSVLKNRNPQNSMKRGDKSLKSPRRFRRCYGRIGAVIFVYSNQLNSPLLLICLQNSCLIKLLSVFVLLISSKCFRVKAWTKKSFETDRIWEFCQFQSEPCKSVLSSTRRYCVQSQYIILSSVTQNYVLRHYAVPTRRAPVQIFIKTVCHVEVLCVLNVHTELSCTYSTFGYVDYKIVLIHSCFQLVSWFNCKDWMKREFLTDFR